MKEKKKKTGQWNAESVPLRMKCSKRNANRMPWRWKEMKPKASSNIQEGRKSPRKGKNTEEQNT